MIGTQIQVRGYHCDAYGHVNNARYLEFLEEGRWSFLQSAVDKEIFNELGLLFVVVNISIRFRKPIFPGDEIVVRVENCEYRRKSIVFSQSIHRDDLLCSDAEVTFVLLNKEDNKAVTIDNQIIEIFQSLLETNA